MINSQTHNELPDPIQPIQARPLLQPPARRKATILKLVGVLLFTALSGTAIYYVTQNIHRQQSLGTQAAVGTASVTLFPESTTLPPDNTFKLMMSASKPTGFAHVELTFDKTKINVVQITPATGLTRIVSQSTPADANANGRIALTYALEPKTTAPSGSFELGSIKVAAVPSTTQLPQTILQVDTASIQIVDMDTLAMTPSVGKATIAFASTSSPVPSPSAKPSIKPSASPSPVTGNSLTIYAAEDATIKAESATAMYGTRTTLETDSSGEADFLMKFTVSGIGTKQVSSAKLRLYNVNSSTVGGQFYLATSNSWSEKSVTWSNAPTVQGSVIGSLSTVRTSRWYDIDVTNVIKQDGTYTIRVKSTSNDGADYSSRETTRKPHLLISTQ